MIFSVGFSPFFKPIPNTGFRCPYCSRAFIFWGSSEIGNGRSCPVVQAIALHFGLSSSAKKRCASGKALWPFCSLSACFIFSSSSEGGRFDSIRPAIGGGRSGAATDRTAHFDSLPSAADSLARYWHFTTQQGKFCHLTHTRVAQTRRLQTQIIL